MKNKALPPHIYLTQCFNYEPLTGIVTWKSRPRSHFNTDRGFNQTNSRFSGKVVGSKDKDGYLIVRIDGTNYRLSRIVWKIYHGTDPFYEIDHIDTNKENNSIANLRDVNHIVNSLNRNKPSSNKSGYLGVHFCKEMRKFRATIRVNGINKSLGFYETPEDAHSAYKHEANLLFGKLKRT